MARELSKLARLVGSDWVNYSHPNVWRREPTTGPERIVLAPAHGHVEILEKLARRLGDSLAILYVLLVSRCGHEPGRYESPPIDLNSCTLFLTSFQEYFEHDGRHHLWVLGPDGTLVYDNHELIYCYGPLAEFEQDIVAIGVTPGVPAIPAPHAHKYNQEFDAQEDEVMSHWDWKRFPLEDDDDP